MTVKPEVVVVGAGPAGGLAARQLARKGHTVLILEEHKKVGQPVHCAGLIGINGLHENGVIPKSKVIIRRVRQSIFHAPGGGQLVLDKGEPHAYVLHRDRRRELLCNWKPASLGVSESRMECVLRFANGNQNVIYTHNLL